MPVRTQRPRCRPSSGSSSLILAITARQGASVVAQTFGVLQLLREIVEACSIRHTHAVIQELLAFFHTDEREPELVRVACRDRAHLARVAARELEYVNLGVKAMAAAM